MKGLHTLQSARGSRRRSRRVGRGHGTGRGTYAGRGIKGQKARSGGRSGITARSIKSYLLRIPKTRGFSAQQMSRALVDIRDLGKHFMDGEHVTLKKMRQKNLLPSPMMRVKILGNGELKKKLHVSAHAFSEAAKAAIEKADGTIEIIAAKRKEPKKATEGK